MFGLFARVPLCRHAVLAVSTLAFTVCFMVWMMFGVIGIPIKKALNLNATEFGLLTAMPVLTGSLIRVPLGIWTDRFGGRIVMAVLMAVTVPAIWLMSYATAVLAFPGHRPVRRPGRRLVLGRHALRARAGSRASARAWPWACTAPATRARPSTSSSPRHWWSPSAGPWCRRSTRPSCSARVLLFWFFSYSDPKHLVSSNVKFVDQLKALKDPKVLRYCQYYSIVFGGYVALSLWMVQYYVGEFGLDIRWAALLAACFSLPGGVLRAIGGWLSDKFGAHSVTWWVMWVSWICLFLLSYPQTDVTFMTVNGPQDLPPRPERLRLHRADVHPGHRLGLRQGQRLQVHQRRLPAQHRHHLRHRRPGRRPGRLRAADHVRRADGPHRHALQRLHADVRRGLGVADLDVLHRGAPHRGDGRPTPRAPSLHAPATAHARRPAARSSPSDGSLHP